MTGSHSDADMTQKSILIICQHFVPYTPALGGVARMLSLVEFLHQRGWKVYVLTSDGVDFGCLGYEEIKEKAEIIYLDDPMKKAIQKGVRAQLKQGTSSRGGWRLSILKLLKVIVYEFLVPDPGIMMHRKYFKAAVNIIDSSAIKNILVSSPPHSMQLVGSSLKNRYGQSINFIVDYRDSWNGRAAFKQQTSLGRYIARKMEKSVLQHCDYFLYVSAPMLKKAEKLYGCEICKKSCLVMNGFDESVSPSPVSRQPLVNRKIRIGHFGMLNGEQGSYRNIVKLLAVLQNYPEILAEVQFEFYGQAKLSEDVNTSGVLFFDNLSYFAARERMLDMDMLLLYHATSGDSDEVITGKFFEYIASRRPILCITPVDMEARRLVDEYGVGVVADVDSPEMIKKSLLGLRDGLKKDYYEGVDISLFSRTKQYEKILPFLN